MNQRLCRRVGLALALAGAAAWAVAAAVLPDSARRSEQAARLAPDSGREGGYFAPEEWVNWVHDLRWAAIAAIVCALGAAPALSRGRVLAGVLLALAWGGALVLAGAQVAEPFLVATLVGGGLPLVALYALAAPPAPRQPWSRLRIGLAVAVGYPFCAALTLPSGIGSIAVLISGGETSADGIPLVATGIMLGACAGMAARALEHGHARGEAPTPELRRTG